MTDDKLLLCKLCGETDPFLFYPTNRVSCKACVSKRAIRWKNNNPDSRWAHSLKYRFKVDPRFYDDLFEGQGKVCALCKQPSPKRRLDVDHDRKCCSGDRSCGRCIRGLLCRGCNMHVGWLEARLGDQRLGMYLGYRFEPC